MESAPLPADEATRLKALHDYQLLDTEPELGFDDLTAIAAQVCGAPIALVSLVDAHRQWFKSRVGLAATETPREVAFCAHAILGAEPFVVPDSFLDARFADNPLATGDPHVRFYAGMPLIAPGGAALGTLCVIDHQPRALSPEQLDVLRRLGRQVVTQIELRRARRMAESSVSAKARFIARVGHELRTPLTGVMGALELLDTTELSVEQRELVALGQQGGRELLHLVKDVVDFSQLENGRMTPDSARFDLRSLGRDVLDELAAPARNKGLELELNWRTAAGPWRIGDERRLRQLLANIVGNAIKFTAKGSVALEVADAGQAPATSFTITDTGSGMGGGELREVGAPFAANEATRQRGLGLGLAISRELARLMGGELHFESEVGRGSRVRCTLPLPERAEADPKETDVSDARTG